jgi:hypothetical protein
MDVNGRLDRFLANRRQRLFPAVLQIPDVKPPPGCEDLGEKALELLKDDVVEVDSGGDPGDVDFLVQLVTHVWRVERQLAELPGSEREKQPLRRRMVDLKATLEAAGVSMRDHTGDPFDAGLNVEVLTYEDVKAQNLRNGAETIIETTRPSVCLHGKVIAPGQVIVGKPV